MLFHFCKVNEDKLEVGANELCVFQSWIACTRIDAVPASVATILFCKMKMSDASVEAPGRLANAGNRNIAVALITLESGHVLSTGVNRSALAIQVAVQESVAEAANATLLEADKVLTLGSTAVAGTYLRTFASSALLADHADEAGTYRRMFAARELLTGREAVASVYRSAFAMTELLATITLSAGTLIPKAVRNEPVRFRVARPTNFWMVLTWSVELAARRAEALCGLTATAIKAEVVSS